MSVAGGWAERRFMGGARGAEETRDDTLVRLARQGSAAACDELIRRYQDRVYTIAFRYVSDPEEALDITQESFLRMIEALPKFREQANFYTWLYRIVVNHCIDRGRRKKHHAPPASLDEITSDSSIELAETRPAMCPYAALEAQELHEQIHAAIAAIPEMYRMVVILADIEGLSTAEIAAIVRCPLITVRTRLHRGRTLIRQRLTGYLMGEECTASSELRRRGDV